jgi:UDPglucose 6-dehydrogenase
MEHAREILPEGEHVTYAKSVLDAAKDADAVVIMTEWPEFAQVDLDVLRRVMKRPIVVDGRNLMDSNKMVQHGFTYFSMGRPPAYPEQGSAVRADAGKKQ